MIMDIRTFTNYHLVKSEDLNHHGTLYAGRSAEWFVEAGFVAAASITRPENIVCLKIHGMTYTQPIQKGDVVRFESKVVLAGRTKLVSYICVINQEKLVVDGFITFIHVDLEGHPHPHGIEIVPTKAEDIALQEKARNLTAS
jgi:acyl-CoA hydrolase